MQPSPPAEPSSVVRKLTSVPHGVVRSPVLCTRVSAQVCGRVLCASPHVWPVDPPPVPTALATADLPSSGSRFCHVENVAYAKPYGTEPSEIGFCFWPSGIPRRPVQVAGHIASFCVVARPVGRRQR